MELKVAPIKRPSQTLNHEQSTDTPYFNSLKICTRQKWLTLAIFLICLTDLSLKKKKSWFLSIFRAGFDAQKPGSPHHIDVPASRQRQHWRARGLGSSLQEALPGAQGLALVPGSESSNGKAWVYSTGHLGELEHRGCKGRLEGC